MWLADALGAASGFCLAWPTWRASCLLKRVARVEDYRAPENAKTSSGFVEHSEVAAMIAKHLRRELQQWNALDDALLKSGGILLFLSFALRFVL